MPNFILTISADTLPEIVGEQLVAQITNTTQGGPAGQFVGPPDAGSFDVDYKGEYGDQLSVVRFWRLNGQDGPSTEAALVQLPFPLLPIPSGGGVVARLA